MHNVIGKWMIRWTIAMVFLGTSFVFAKPKKVQNYPKTPALLKLGEKVYKENCASCHGLKGNGLGMAGKYLNPKPRNFIGGEVFKNGEKPKEVFQSIRDGLTGTTMAGFKSLGGQKLWAVSYYVLHFRNQKKMKKQKKTSHKK